MNILFSKGASQDDAIGQLHRLVVYVGIISGILANVALYQTFESMKWVSFLLWGGILIGDVMLVRRMMAHIATIPLVVRSEYLEAAARENRWLGGGIAYFIVMWMYAFVTAWMLLWLPIWWP